MPAARKGEVGGLHEAHLVLELGLELRLGLGLAVLASQRCPRILGGKEGLKGEVGGPHEAHLVLELGLGLG